MYKVMNSNFTEGKGHEPYQEINGEKNPFDERIIVKDIINKM